MKNAITKISLTLLLACGALCAPLAAKADTTLDQTCYAAPKAAPTQQTAPDDVLSRFGVSIGTKNAQVGGTYAVVRASHLDLDAMVLTGKGDRKNNESYVQRHYHLGLGAFTPIAHTNISLGVYSVLDGSHFKRVQYGINVRL